MELLEAVRRSPSWANTQCWEVIVVRDEERKKRLAELVSPRNPAQEGVAEAPVVMVMCAQKGVSGFKKGAAVTDKGDWYMFDLGIACQNLCLAAHDMGLGTVHVGSIEHAPIAELLQVPPNVEVVELIPVGYPAKESASPKRRELADFVHAEQYSQKLF